MEKIIIKNGCLTVPQYPIILYIEGDGIGPDIWKATRSVVDAAVKMAYGREIAWKEIYAGEKAYEKFGEWLPEVTIESIREHLVAIKGPLTTPVGGGIRSLNVTLRQRLDLFSCVRPVRYFQGVPSPVKEPQKLDVVIYRENSEDVYSGIEWQSGTKECGQVIDFLTETMKSSIPRDAGIGIKPISPFATKRLVRAAIEFALANNRKNITLVHKGNIMKYTEGAFRDWGYELAKEEFSGTLITEEQLWDEYGGKQPEGKIVIKDRIADAMFQQLLLRPDEYDVIATPNLNGDYLSDACAAQVGGLGMAPGANIGDECALFEATHGTAPKYAGQNKVNPGSLLLSAVMMLKHIGWTEAGSFIVSALKKTILDATVTYDLQRQMPGSKLLSTSQFGQAIIKNMDKRGANQ